MNRHETKNTYVGLAVMLLLHFVVMFGVMYTMVDRWENVIINLNQFYMTMMMVLPMTIGMLLFMSSMYPNKKLNFFLYAVSSVLFLVFLYFMRKQTFIGDRQFLNSMIPHHSGAILMCEKATLSDPEIVKLCDEIIKAQKDEIEVMREMLKRF